MAPGRVGAVIAWTCLAPAALAAQLEVTPAVGAYLPTGKMFDQYQSGCSCHSTIAQQPGALFGVHVGFGAVSRVALETTLDFGWSPVQVAQPGQPTVSLSGTVVIIGARLHLSARRGAVTTPYLSGGVAYLSHGSIVYQSLSGNNGGAFSVGAGLRVVVTPHLVGHIDFEDYHYSTALGGMSAPAQRDNDLVLLAGLGLIP